jgi:hypothetical protein
MSHPSNSERSPPIRRMPAMSFVVELLPESQELAKSDVVDTVVFETDDLSAVIARMRIILSSTSYKPAVGAFRIVDGSKTIYHETRQQFPEGRCS